MSPLDRDLGYVWGIHQDEKIYLVATRDLPVLIDQLKHILTENNELN